MIKDPLNVARLFRYAHRNLIYAREISASMRIDEVYPFALSQIAGVHTHKIGFGDGVWFELKDGRVFDQYGDETESTPGLYERNVPESADDCRATE